MELFKNFKETVFYKKDSELEYQLKILKKLNLEFPNNEQIAQKLKICEYGCYGEHEIEYELQSANLGMYVLHDINLKYKDLTAQIDYVIITKAKIYFVECKNLIGNITVNARGEFSREYTYKNKKIKEAIYSPIRQAERHIEIFKKIWNEKHTSFLDKMLYSKNLDDWYKSLVVFSNSKGILNLKYCPKELKNKIIRSDLLVNYLKKDIENTNKDFYLNQKEMHECAYNLMTNYHQEVERDYEKELTKNINLEKTEKSVINENVRKSLNEFRKEKSKKYNIPAYYIFNNEELENLLKHMPKDIETLNKLNILSEVKIKLHGKEIVDIINKS